MLRGAGMVGVPLPKPRGLGEWSMLTAGLADGPETGGSAPSPTEELRWAGTSHSSSEGWSSAGSSSKAPSSICSVRHGFLGALLLPLHRTLL